MKLESMGLKEREAMRDLRNREVTEDLQERRDRRDLQGIFEFSAEDQHPEFR